MENISIPKSVVEAWHKQCVDALANGTRIPDYYGGQLSLLETILDIYGAE